MIDLRNCKKGDKLRIRMTEKMKELVAGQHTDVITYVGEMPIGSYYEHSVEYSNGSGGTRAHNGGVFKMNRLPDDMDVIEILEGE